MGSLFVAETGLNSDETMSKNRIATAHVQYSSAVSAGVVPLRLTCGRSSAYPNNSERRKNFRVQTLEPRIYATPNVIIGIHDLLHFFEAKIDFYEATLVCTNKWSHWFQHVHRAHCVSVHLLMFEYWHPNPMTPRMDFQSAHPPRDRTFHLG